MLVLLSGRAKSGKSSVADHLKKHYGFKEVSLAASLKAAAVSAFGFKDDQVYTQEGKAAVDPYWAITPRLALQLMGSELFQFAWPAALSHAGQVKAAKQLGRLFWCMRLWRDIQPMVKAGLRLVCSDVRFEHEMEFFKLMAGRQAVAVRIDRRSVVPDRTWIERLQHRLGLKNFVDLHMSETALDAYKFDYVLDSNGNLGGLLAHADALMARLNICRITDAGTTVDRRGVRTSMFNLQPGLESVDETRAAEQWAAGEEPEEDGPDVDSVLGRGALVKALRSKKAQPVPKVLPEDENSLENLVGAPAVLASMDVPGYKGKALKFPRKKMPPKRLKFPARKSAAARARTMKKLGIQAPKVVS